ncbi:MAG: phytoene synthase [Rhodobiaceae bacterium]|nr:phytoene synthase [Rhodobiaceae bacterium]
MSKKKFLAIYAKSFNWAGTFLPKDTYEDCSSLYNFCRSVDDIADCDDKLSAKVQKLNSFIDSFNSKNCDDEIITDMKRLIIKYNISDKIIFDLFDGVKTDLVERLEFLSEKEIFLYSYRVAGTVGLMMAKILRVNDRTALLGAIDLGIAMQLTNIARDVIEDKISNRFYIKSSFSDLTNTIGIADKFYDNAFFSIRAIPFRMRFAILVARRVYRRIGYKVLRCGDFETYEKSGRIYVHNFEKLYETIISLLDLLKLSLAKRSVDITVQYHHLINEDIDYNERF